MVLELSKYEGAATAFLKAYPVGTSLYGDELLGWAADHKNGLATDMLIDDPKKRLSAIRRHLNAGGSSRNLAEANRFYLDMVDSKQTAMTVVSFAEYSIEQADASLEKSIKGAISPGIRAKSNLEAVKTDELSDEDRELHDQWLAELVEREVPLKKLLGEQLIDHYVRMLVAEKGITPEAARGVLDAAPVLSGYQKLLKFTR